MGRPRGKRGRVVRVPDGGDESTLDIARILEGKYRAETRRGARWNVQPVSATSAVKEYVCPGCAIPISPSTAHLVTWRADGLLGDAADIAARRHWHTHCWRIS